jgi:hypothetical protein
LTIEWFIGFVGWPACEAAMRNKDGSYGSKATNKELAECYGLDAVRMLSYLNEVAVERWDDYVYLVIQQVKIAANHGRKSLRQK